MKCETCDDCGHVFLAGTGQRVKGTGGGTYCSQHRKKYDRAVNGVSVIGFGISGLGSMYYRDAVRVGNDGKIMRVDDVAPRVLDKYFAERIVAEGWRKPIAKKGGR